jgi:hypothetical protein
VKAGTVTALCILFLLFAAAHSAGQKEYMSPDGKYVASVATGQRSGESKVVVRTKDGRTICSKSYESQDGEHGFGVEYATWTPDSKFFVYSMASSGGHQPWHFPADFCSVQDKSIRSLDSYVGSIITPDFDVKAPDIVKGKIMGKGIEDQVTFEVGLTNLVALGMKK